MKRFVVALLLLAVMLSGMMNVYAEQAQVTVEVRASKSEVQVGDTVEYTVLATGSGVVAMQFELRFPAGLRYVPNSGATPEKLAQKLGVPAADWTELSKMFTFYNDVGITFAKGTEICRFSCVAEQEGEWAPELYELLPFNEDFEEFPPDLQVQKIMVTATGEQTVSTEPEKPDASDEPETKPSVDSTEPHPTTEPQSTTEPMSTPATTKPEIVPDAEKPEMTVPVHNSDNTPQDLPEDDTLNVGAQDPNTPDQDLQNQEKTPKNTLLWLIPLGAVTAAGGAIAAFILLKKKTL